MLFCLLEYLQMLEHMENIWEKMQAYFSRWKRGGGGRGGASFFFFLLILARSNYDHYARALLTLRLWGEQGTFSVSFEEIFSSQE